MKNFIQLILVAILSVAVMTSCDERFAGNYELKCGISLPSDKDGEIHATATLKTPEGVSAVRSDNAQNAATSTNSNGRWEHQSSPEGEAFGNKSLNYIVVDNEQVYAILCLAKVYDTPAASVFFSKKISDNYGLYNIVLESDVYNNKTFLAIINEGNILFDNFEDVYNYISGSSKISIWVPTYPGKCHRFDFDVAMK